jgi:hypothetical protein
MMEQGVAPAGGRGRILPHPGGSGVPLGRHHDRSARSSLDWDRPMAGNARRMPRPRKRGLELSCGRQGRSESRDGAPEGAAPWQNRGVHITNDAPIGAPSPSSLRGAEGLSAEAQRATAENTAPPRRQKTGALPHARFVSLP